MSNDLPFGRVDIEELIGAYTLAMLGDYAARRELAAIETTVLFNEPPTGKNADARALSQKVILLACDEFQRARQMADYAAVERERRHAEIGLVKAWLYAQG